MKLDTIGKNIRKFREIKKLRQEDLAEITDLTTNSIDFFFLILYNIKKIDNKNLSCKYCIK